MNNEEHTIDLQELFNVLIKNILLIMSITVAFTFAAYLFTEYGVEKKYESKTLFTVNSEENETPTTSDQFRVGTELAKRYSIISKSDLVIDQVVTDLESQNIEIKPSAVRNSFTVNSEDATNILRIVVEYGDPVVAQKIAKSVTDTSMTVYQTKYKGVEVEYIDEAKENTNHVSPNLTLNVIIGFVLGGMVSVGFVFLKEFLNRKMKTEKDIEQHLHIPYFGSIPDMKKLKNK